MDLITLNSNLSLISSTNSNHPVNNKDKLFLGFCNYPLQFCYIRNKSSSSSIAITYAKKKKNSPPEFSAFQPTIIEEVIQSGDDDEDFEELGDDELLITDHFDDEEFIDDDEDYFDDEYATENAEVYAGDGAEGGGISLAGTWWDKEALAIAEKVTKSFDGDLGIYAFRTLANARIQVRIEKISTKSGSPSISDIEAFSTAYRAQLDEAELAKTIPENIYLEVSSPGVERVLRIPEELDRFKERNIYVKYLDETTGSASENDGVFRLVSLDLETKCCTWGLADVRINREKAGKGRPMSKKQRELRVTTPFDLIRLARLYSEI